MFVNSSVVAAAKQRGQKNLALGASVGERFTRVDEVVDLLATSRNRLRSAWPTARIWPTTPWR
jgi:hypothetical protein